MVWGRIQRLLLRRSESLVYRTVWSSTRCSRCMDTVASQVSQYSILPWWKRLRLVCVEVVVKKPKSKKPKVKIPKDALIVDYGNKRVILPYKHPVDLYNNTELDTISEWCEKTFPKDEWRCSRSNWPGYMYFLKEKYLTMFLIRWAKWITILKNR